MSVAGLADAITPSFVRSGGYSEKDKTCMERAMFFESHRSSRDGMIAVGTVVMNRKRSGQYPETVCGVVGQKGQFAPGVLTKKMKSMPDVEEAAIAVLKGERHPKLKNAMHFHTAGLRFRYKNMHYVTVAGGNAFYEKRGRKWQPLPPEGSSTVMMASAPAAEPTPAAFAEAPRPALAPIPAAPAAPVAVAAAATPGGVLIMPEPVHAKATTIVREELPAPSADRFGGNQVTFVSGPAPAMMGVEATQQQADAIGVLLLSQDRPQ